MADYPKLVFRGDDQTWVFDARGEAAAAALGWGPKAVSVYEEYPKWLYHKTEEPVIVDGPGAEARARSLGYGQRGAADPVAFKRFTEDASPLYEPVQYPMWVNGVIVNNDAEASAQRAKMAAADAPPPAPASPPPVIDEELYAQFAAFQKAQKTASKPVSRRTLSAAEQAEVEAAEAAERAA
jgi:hypothetical protein